MDTAYTARKEKMPSVESSQADIKSADQKGGQGMVQNNVDTRRERPEERHCTTTGSFKTSQGREELGGFKTADGSLAMPRLKTTRRYWHEDHIGALQLAIKPID